jgi:integrase
MGIVVRQKVKGKGEPWWVFISHDGKRTSRRVGDKKAAEAVAREISAQLQLGKFDFKPRGSAPPFQVYAQSWLETSITEANDYKPSTIKDYELLLENHINPEFEDIPVNEISCGGRRKVEAVVGKKL